MLLSIVLGAAAAFIFYKFLRIVLIHRRYSHIPGPKRTSFLFGNVEEMKNTGRKHGNFGVFHLELLYKYGDVFLTWRMTTPVVSIFDTDAIKNILSDIKTFRKPAAEERFLKLSTVGKVRFIGEHSILSDYGGPIWEHKKRILDPAFSITKLKAHIPKLYKIGERVAENLIQMQQKFGYVEFNAAVAPFTIDAISSAGFSVVDEGSLAKFSKGLNSLGVYFNSSMKRNPLLRSRAAKLLGLGDKNEEPASKELHYIRELGKDIIMTRVTDGSFNSVHDILDFIIVANQDKATSDLNIENCLDDFMTMYEAGNTTTATTLGFTMGELARNPGVALKLQQEVDSIWQDRGMSEDSAVEDIVQALKDMPYLEAVINESLRHHPPVVINIRKAGAPMVIQGYNIPAGTQTLISQYAIQHHPKHWDNPDIFNPERFIGKKLVPYTYLPFLLGPRRCLGKNFAVLEMKIFLAIWISRFTFGKAPGKTTEKMKTEQGILCRSVDNYIFVKER